MRVRLQIKLPPGLRHSLSVKRGGGASANAGELSTGINERGRRYTIVEVPGTGLSFGEIQQPRFTLALTHSLHSRLRRIQVLLRFVYIGVVVAVIASFFVFGLVFSYARMTRKVADSNHLHYEVENTRTRSPDFQQTEQLASLEPPANEVSVTSGIKQKLDEPGVIVARGKLAPTVSETVAEYNRLRGPKLSGFGFPRLWHVHTRPEIWPVDGPLMSGYGQRTDPFSGEGTYHMGVDISARLGTPAVATADGIVVFADSYGGYGRLVVVDHGDDYETYYAHLSRFDVVVGQEIRQGEPVGAIGTSGRVTAPHLHYEIRVRKTPVNPYRYLVANNPK